MPAPKATPGVTRGCGEREQDAAYLECGLTESEDALPLERFLADPPKPFIPDKKIGQIPVRRDGTLHVIDWIGEQHYPYATDFLEEVRTHGLSRRLNKSFADKYGDLLTDESRVICVHARAVPSMPGLAHTYEDAKGLQEYTRSHCRIWRASGDESHLQTADMPCSRHLWFDPPADDGTITGETGAESMYGQRAVASIRYQTTGGPDGLDLHMTPGIIASFPISRVSVIASEDGAHVETHERMTENIPHLPVEVERA